MDRFGLSTGARYDKRRFGSEMDFFHRVQGKREEEAVVERPTSTALDFFGSNSSSKTTSSSGSQQKKQAAKNGKGKVKGKRKQRKAEEEEEDEDEEQQQRNGQHGRKRSRGSAAVGDAHEEEEEEEEEEEDNVQLFSGSRSTPKARKKQQKSAAQREQIKAEEVAAFRHRLRIVVSGEAPPDPVHTFDAMQMAGQIRTVLLHNIEKSDYKEPTPIQMQCIPAMLGGRDVLGAAPTGSGKTAAFAIPVLAKLQSTKKGGVRALVLAPARELAQQIFAYFQRLSLGRKFKISLLKKATAASLTANKGKHAVAHHCDVLVATPLRLLHVIKSGGVDLHTVETLVLDEADKLFEMGFVEQVDDVLAACTHPHVQRAMFSATMLPGVEELAASVLRDPVKVTIGKKNAGATTIKQRLVFVGRESGKLLAIRQIVQEGLKPPVLIFLQNKERAQALFHELIYDGINVEVIHSDRTQSQREAIIKKFRSQEIWVLIATDLIGRGMDFKGVNMVINYDLPQSAVSYIHRIGRTGRAGRQGEAITLYTERDMDTLRSIANVVKLSGCEVPDWMLSLRKAKTYEKRRAEKQAPRRGRISTVTTYDTERSRRVKMAVQNSKRQKKSTGAKQQTTGNHQGKQGEQAAAKRSKTNGVGKGKKKVSAAKAGL